MPRRISVKGSSGSGKSTVAAELAGRLGLTYIELDALHHGPNWSEPTAEEFRAIVRQAMDVAPAGWVVDGNYDSKLGDLVVDEADMIVWLDLPISVKFPRVWRRTMHRIWKDMSSGTATGNVAGPLRRPKLGRLLGVPRSPAAPTAVAQPVRRRLATRAAALPGRSPALARDRSRGVG
jgi:hypothetical protein